MIAEITLARPSATSPTREFDVIVDAPPDVTQVEADSPYYAGTIAFFGGKMNMEGMSSDVTFSVPMPRAAAAYRNLAAANAPVSIRVVPSNGQGVKAPVLKAATLRAR